MGTKYHDGERKVQKITGEEVIANSNGRVIVDTIVKGAFNFVSNQPMVVVSTVDLAGAVWTSTLVGENGFVKVLDERRLTIDLAKLKSTKKDIFFKNIEDSPAIGMLFMEPATRRRYRINGDIVEQGSSIEIQVEEAYPNCPKYIQKRTVNFLEDNHLDTSTAEGSILSSLEVKWIESADTLFVGSSSKGGRLDASHRGGNPGFVEIAENNTVRIPDYAGNSMYNTLGNFIENPNAGVTFVDFAEGKTLQLTGKAEILFDQNSEENLQKTTGTGRYWTLHIERWISTENHHQANWEFKEFSPFNP
ncbi:MAG: pyridoxamine 5'-phosphate oxidase family protein [Cyclobacteriaceae bacterium]